MFKKIIRLFALSAFLILAGFYVVQAAPTFTGMAGSLPATTGSTQTGLGIRINANGTNEVLDLGSLGGGAGSWLQVTNLSTLGSYYPLMLNPRGGNVGIGVTNPGSYKLNVGGSINISGNSNFDGSFMTTIGEDAGRLFSVFQGPNGTYPLSIYGETGDIVLAEGDFGNVGVGVTNPGARLDVTGSFRNSLATTHTALGGAGNVFVMADNNGALYSSPSSNSFIYGSHSYASPSAPYWATIARWSITGAYQSRSIQGEYYQSGGGGMTTRYLITALGRCEGTYGVGYAYSRYSIHAIGGNADAFSNNIRVVKVVDNGSITTFELQVYVNTWYWGSWNIAADGSTATVFSTAQTAGTPVADQSQVVAVGHKFTGNSIFDGNVGIGTTVPNAKLTVGTAMTGTALGSTIITNAGALGTTGGNTLTLANFGFTSTNQSSLGIRAYRVGSGSAWNSATAITLGMDVDSTVNAGAYLTLKSDGFMGVGTTNPAAKLTVAGATEGIRIVGAGTTGDASMSYMQFYDSDGATVRGYVGDGSAGNDDIYLQASTGDLHLGDSVSGTSINSQGGKVGIGLTNPGAKLDIVNNFSQGANSSVAYGTKGATTVTGSGTIANYYGAYFESNLNTSAQGGSPSSANNYGIYAKTASTNFNHANSGTANYYGGYFEALGSVDGTDTSRNVGIYVNASGADSNYAAVLMGGNVGIGTTAPAGNLDVDSVSTSAGYWVDGKAALTGESTDNWLRLNANSSWTNGVYTPGVLRSDGGIISGVTSSQGAGTIIATGNIYMNNQTTYGLRGNSLHADTINTGVTNDPLEINYVTAGPTKICSSVSCATYSAYFDTSGNVGIGGITPGVKLDVAGSATIRGVSNGSVVLKLGSTSAINAIVNTDDQMYFNIDSDNTSGSQGFHFGADTATYPATDLMTISDTGIVTIQNRLIINGTSKITVSTWDPLYTIGGKKYATYGTGMIGVKEETVGLATLDCRGNACFKTINFRQAPEASDLWLFAQTTDLENSFDKLSVQLTPSFLGQVWYEKDAAKLTLTIKATRIGHSPAEVSYRLTAPRFDHAQWSNTSDEKGEGLNLDKFRAEQGR